MTELSNAEIISKIKDHVEELVDCRNITGLTIFIQSTDGNENGLYMIGEIKNLDILGALAAFYKNPPTSV